MKIGTVGSNFIVHRFLKAAIDNGYELIGTYSRSIETANKLREEYGFKSVYTNYTDMLQNKNIDTIYIASPNSLHFIQCKEALLCGKNVICEKPFTSTFLELSELIKIAKANKLFLFEAITTIHLPNFLYIKENIHKIGKIRVVLANFSQYSSRYPLLLAGEEPNNMSLKFAGGALVDLNIYNLHLVMNLFAKPIKANYFPHIYKNGIDTSGHLILKYEDFNCSLTAAKDSGGENFAIIQGEAGYIKIIGEVSKCREVEFMISGTKEIINMQNTDNALFYELNEFKRIISSKNFEHCYNLLDYCKSVYSVLHKARKEAKIFYPESN